MWTNIIVLFRITLFCLFLNKQNLEKLFEWHHTLRSKTSMSSAKKQESEVKQAHSEQAPEAEAQQAQPQKNLYEREVDRYRHHLERGGFEAAYPMYGFTLIHSLQPEEKVELFQKLGFDPKTPEDFYNLGCVAAKKENFEKAREYFEKTIDLAPDFEQAYYNLAVVLENLGLESEAAEKWGIFCEFLDENSSEATIVTQHVEELKKTLASSGKAKK